MEADALPINMAVLDRSFLHMIPLMGGGGFHEDVAAHGGANCLYPEAVENYMAIAGGGGTRWALPRQP